MASAPVAGGRQNGNSCTGYTCARHHRNINERCTSTSQLCPGLQNFGYDAHHVGALTREIMILNSGRLIVSPAELSQPVQKLSVVSFSIAVPV
jgi:hypothetical protein